MTLDPKDASKAQQRPSARTILAATILVLAGLLVYANSFAGTFVYDDHCNIVNYPHNFWPGLWGFIRKPLWRSSVELNYTLGGLDARGYHSVNLTIHLLAALTLFGIARRTMLSRRVRQRLGEAGTPLAAAIALIWLVHPLQTESVTYIVQRRESMMGLFYLLTLYCLIRSSSARRPWVWFAPGILSCAIGMNIKPVMMTAPVIAVIYDRIFLSRSFKELLRRRWILYLGLVVTWVVLFKHGHRMTSQGMGIPQISMSVWDYFCSQFGVVTHYLRLSFFPDALVLDYGWPVARQPAQIVPYAILIGVLVALTLWALWRYPAWGFVGTWFFAILAPTSSIITIDYLAFEHRMYLSLAAVATLTVVGAYLLGGGLLRKLISNEPVRKRLGGVLGVVLLTVCATGLSARTILRNRDYHTRQSMWLSVTRHRQGNYRAYNNLGVALAEKGDETGAIASYRRAVTLWPGYADAHGNLAAALARQGAAEEAGDHYREAIRLDPTRAGYHYGLGRAMAAQAKRPEAIEHFTKAIQLDPAHAAAQFQLAAVYSAKGEAGLAIQHYRRALAIRRDWAEAINNLAWVLATVPDPKLRNCDEAIRLAQRAYKLTDERKPRMLVTLGMAYKNNGQIDQSLATLKKARQIAKAGGQGKLAEQIRKQIEQLRKKKITDHRPTTKPQPN